MLIKPLAGLTRWLRALMYTHVGLSAAAALIGVYGVVEYSTVQPSAVAFSETVLPSDYLATLIAIPQVAIGIAANIVFLVWVYRANKNLHSLSNTAMVHSPGWSVGWFFIPIANLFKPYQVLRELWVVSSRGRVSSTALVGWWWAIWLVSNFVGRLAARSVGAVADTATKIMSLDAYIFSDMLTVASALLGVAMIASIASAYAANYDETQPAAPSAGWYPDPTKRHELRYWDGHSWQAAVSTHGVRSDDAV
ncbi:DUF4328 domain-containing protein [bacterium]|nr:MAG: DUF4328 domain-containing protein [bacterium]